jgi:spore coat-associated protein N
MNHPPTATRKDHHMTATAAPRTSRRSVLLALVTMLAAIAIAAASGATFNASSANTGNVHATGSLTTANSKADAAIFNQTNLKPGDTVIGTVTITNTGTLPAIYRLNEAADNPFTGDLLNLVITDITDPAAPTTVYNGTLGKVSPTAALDLGTWEADEARTYRFTSTLHLDATDAEQSKTATATYTWNATQTAPITIGG